MVLLIDGGNAVPLSAPVSEALPETAVLERTWTILTREGRLFRDLHARARDEAAEAARAILDVHGSPEHPLVYMPAPDADAALVVHYGTVTIARDEETRRIVRDAHGEAAYVERGMPSTARPT